jgi:hypothetical protein
MKNIKIMKMKKLIYSLTAMLFLSGGGVLLWQYSDVFGRQTPSDRQRIDRAHKERLVRDNYRDDIESARAQGKKEVILPSGIAMPHPELSLEELLREYSLLKVKVVDKETKIDEPGADISTWYKLEIVETLHRQEKTQSKIQEKLGDAPLLNETPSRLLPLLPSESLLVVQGGAITVDDMTVVRKVSSNQVIYIPKEEYLIVGNLEFGGKLFTPASGAAGVFQVKNNNLKSFGPERHRLVREIKDRYGDDLGYLRAGVQSRLGREK